jgi:hypothetical protein
VSGQVCPRCKEVRPYLDFIGDRGKERRNCNICQPLVDLSATLSRYGLTIATYEAMVEAQDRKCRICRRSVERMKERLQVDHCHSTGKVRGLICRDCNTGLARFKDHATILRNAQAYLAEANWGVPYEPEDIKWQ